jgi:hypothetical protein
MAATRQFTNTQNHSTAAPITAEALMRHVRAISGEIGPRPAGSAAEAEAFQYIRRALDETGLVHGRDLPFQTPNTWGAPVLAALGVALLGNLLPTRAGRLIGAAAAGFAAHETWKLMGAREHQLQVFYPTTTSKTLVVRIPPTGEARQKLVFVGHTDTNKHRLSFSKELLPHFHTLSTTLLVTLALNALAQLLGAFGLPLARPLRQATLLGLLGSVVAQSVDELGGYVDGANDNASALACVLGMGAHFSQQRLQHTEVWLAFTGAEEVGCLGIHALLDAYDHELKGAYFVDFEMVGAGDLVYVTQHSGGSYLNGYAPDEDSLKLALATAQQNPSLGVRGAPMRMMEEVGALRSRGHKALCIAGQGADGWLAHWHQYNDNLGNIQPAALEKAARFAVAYANNVDAQAEAE